MSTTSTRSLPVWVLAGVPFVVLWRGLAVTWPSSFTALPENLMIPTTLMGLLFLCSGVISYNRAPSRWSVLFLVYCIGSGIHWGGSVGFQPPALELALLFFYLAVTVMAQAALFHLALLYPSGSPVRTWVHLIYAPAIGALVAVPMAGYLPLSVSELVVGLLLITGKAYALGGALFFVLRLFRVDADLRRESGLVLIVGAVVAGTVFQLLAASGLLPGQPEAWNLILFIVPLSIAVALMSRDPSV